MIEALFVNNKTIAAPKEANKKATVAPYKQEERVLDPKKSQNIAILLRALNVTLEEVTEALLDGTCCDLVNVSLISFLFLNDITFWLEFPFQVALDFRIVAL